MQTNVVQEVKSRLNVVDFVGEYIRLTKAGSSFKGLCPFHKEKTPSFVVSEERQSWHCFGCQKGGDVFTFFMEIEGSDFREALKILADRVGVIMPEYNPKTEQKTRSLHEVLEEATKWYEQNLHSPAGERAKRYLLDRGIDEESMRMFRLGYAPNEWNAVEKQLFSLGFETRDIEPSGLLVVSRDRQTSAVRRNPIQRTYDRFRDRIIFPVSDILGRVVGQSARVMPGGDEKQGKYINTPETPLYHKSSILYGIFQAKQSIKKENQAIVVEGNMDVIALHQNGFPNAVAVSGTAMTEQHIGILSRYTKNIILFFDMDAAGREAAYKSSAACLRGGMRVSLVSISEGKDAADLAKSNPESLRLSLRGAKGAMEFFVEEAFAQSGVLSSERKNDIVERLLPLLDAIASEVEQFDWVRKIAERMEVQTLSVAAMLDRYVQTKNAFPRHSAERAGESISISQKTRTQTLREAILGRMFQSSEVWKAIDRQVREFSEKEVSDLFLDDAIARKALEMGKHIEYDFDQFRLALDDADLVQKAQEMYVSFFSFGESLESLDAVLERSLLEETEALFREFEKEAWRAVLHRLAGDMQKANRSGNTSTNSKLVHRFGEVSQKVASFGEQL